MPLPLHQAASLNRRAGAPQDSAPVIAVVSGKGGVGKTFVAVNLALALRQLGQSPLLVDLDWGLGNVDVALGIASQRHIGHVLAGECGLREAVIHHNGLAILPNGCGDHYLANLSPGLLAGFFQSVREVGPAPSVVVADTHPGIGPLTLGVIEQAALTVVISTADPTSITDTYALFKVLRDMPQADRAVLLINQAGSPEQAYEAATHLNAVSARFLGREVAYWGHVLHEGAVARSVQQQRAVMEAAPRGPAAAAMLELAQTAVRLTGPAPAGAAPAVGGLRG